MKIGMIWWKRAYFIDSLCKSAILNEHNSLDIGLKVVMRLRVKDSIGDNSIKDGCSRAFPCSYQKTEASKWLVKAFCFDATDNSH